MFGDVHGSFHFVVTTWFGSNACGMQVNCAGNKVQSPKKKSQNNHYIDTFQQPSYLTHTINSIFAYLTQF